MFTWIRSYAYARCRYQLFNQHIQQLTQQLRQFGLVVFAILGAALPALFYGLLLAFGILLEQQASPQQSYLILLIMLLVQGLLLLMLKPAILASHYRQFCLAMSMPNWLHRLLDILLSVLCQPVLWLSTLIAANVDRAHLWQSLPLWQLIGLQLIVTILTLYRTTGLLWFLLLSTGAWLVSPWLNLSQQLLALTTLAILCLKLNQPLPHKQISLNHAWQLWLQFFLTRPQPLLMRGGLSLLVLLSVQVALAQRPDLGTPVYLLSAPLLVLINASTQLDCQQFMQTHRGFFAAYFFKSTARLWCYAPGFLLTLIALLALALIQGQWGWCLLQLPGLLLCICWGQHRPNQFIFGWLASVLISNGLIYLVAF